MLEGKPKHFFEKEGVESQHSMMGLGVVKTSIQGLAIRNAAAVIPICLGLSDAWAGAMSS
jgi:hypothetical protein